jgi:hypothetical protein
LTHLPSFRGARAPEQAERSEAVANGANKRANPESRSENMLQLKYRDSGSARFAVRPE